MTDDDILQAFMKDASKWPLLTRAEEQNLGRRICDGDKEAFNELVQRNLRLVAMVAMRTPTSPGLSRTDLIQEGTFGLIRAAEKFDWRKGFKFSTYAVCWIKQSVSRAVSTYGRSIRLPQHTHDDLAVLRRTRHELEDELGHPPAYSQIAERMRIPEEKVAFLEDVSRDIFSLQQELTVDGGTLEDVVPYEETELLDLDLSEELGKALELLTAREREAVMARHGLDGSHSRTWRELGDELGIKKESARSLEQRGIAKLRDALSG